MAEQLALTFDKDLALGYMVAMQHFEAQRDELNEAITECRAEAQQMLLPTKAIEAAIKAAKSRRKSAISAQEFGWLMDEAETLFAAQEAQDSRTVSHGRQP